MSGPPRRWQSRFEEPAAPDPANPLANLVDIMLVFACGLIAALAAMTGGHSNPAGAPVTAGRELSAPPAPAAAGGPGLMPVGQVYRDPASGQLLLFEAAAEATD